MPRQLPSVSKSETGPPRSEGRNLARCSVRPLRATEFTSRLLDVGLIRLRRARHLTGKADPPVSLLQIAPFRGVSLRSQEQRDLQRLTGEPRKFREFQESDAFCVLVDLLVVDNPIVPVPAGNGRKCLRARVEGVRPSFQAHGRTNANPLQAAVGKESGRRADSLPGGEVEIMARHRELPATDPELKQS